MSCSSRVIGAALALAMFAPLTADAQTAERHVYVTVLDKDGTPLSGLTAEHFAVREGGRDRGVVRVEPLDTPMHVAVVLDTSFGPALPIDSVRSAVGDFVERLAAAHHVALYTVAERPTRVTPFTRNVPQLRAAVANVFARPESRTYLIDTIDLVLADLKPLEPARPVIVAFTTENVEASNMTAATVMKQMIARFTVFHAIAFTNAATGAAGRLVRDGGNTTIPGRSEQLGRLNTEGEGDRERTRLLAQGTAVTAGSLQRIVSVTALKAPLFRLASEFAYSYRLTFAGPQADKPLKDLQIGLLVEGVTVRAIAAPDMAKQAR
jgi:VWFA-related protein